MQVVSADKVRKMQEERGHWEKMHAGKLLASVRSTRPAVIAPEGKSEIVSYWDEHLQYLCTIHRVTSKEGKVVHEDVKDAYLDGIRYQVKD